MMAGVSSPKTLRTRAGEGLGAWAARGVVRLRAVWRDGRWRRVCSGVLAGRGIAAACARAEAIRSLADGTPLGGHGVNSIVHGGTDLVRPYLVAACPTRRWGFTWQS